jgi:hypothetical protein
MATLSLTDEQVVQLVKQLPPQSKRRVLTDLTAECDRWWQTTASDGENDMRRLAAARGLAWDTMTETQREAFVDDIGFDSTKTVEATDEIRLFSNAITIPYAEADADDDAVLECAVIGTIPRQRWPPFAPHGQFQRVQIIKAAEFLALLQASTR